MNKSDKKRILIAEDTAVGRKVISRFLTEAGFGVTAVGDGQAVIDSLSGMRYDLVIMDCMMPVLDGFEATRAIRRGDAGEEQSGIPVIALTGLGSDADQRKCREAGMDDFVPKPVDYEELIGTVQRALSRKRVRDEAAADHLAQSQQRELLKSLDEWSPGFLDSVIEQFLDELPCEMARLKAAVEKEDLSAMREVAHRLRGSADVVSAGTLSTRAKALERACASENLALARQLGPALVIELETFSGNLDRDQ